MHSLQLIILWHINHLAVYVFSHYIDLYSFGIPMSLYPQMPPCLSLYFTLFYHWPLSILLFRYSLGLLPDVLIFSNEQVDVRGHQKESQDYIDDSNGHNSKVILFYLRHVLLTVLSFSAAKSPTRIDIIINRVKLAAVTIMIMIK